MSRRKKERKKKVDGIDVKTKHLKMNRKKNNKIYNLIIMNYASVWRLKIWKFWVVDKNVEKQKYL